ncbi:MAG: hypothetical protein ACYDFU_05820 [Nitrospirota bacterium]
MRKGPEIGIIGSASPESKEQTKQEIEHALFEHYESLPPQEGEQLRKFEYPKSEKELALIGFANNETDKLMREAGVEPYDIPAENYHIIPPDLYKKAAGSSGKAVTFTTRQGIFLNAQDFRDNPVNFGATALHETLHLKAHFSMEMECRSAAIARSAGAISTSLSEFRPSSTAGINFFTDKQISSHFSNLGHSPHVSIDASRFFVGRRRFRYTKSKKAARRYSTIWCKR